MDIKLLSDLLMLSGALHDIAEKSKEETTKRQLKEVQDRIESLGVKYLPSIMLKIKNKQL